MLTISLGQHRQYDQRDTTIEENQPEEVSGGTKRPYSEIQQDQSCYFLNLINDVILDEIMPFLHGGDTRALETTCKRLFKLSENSHVWKDLYRRMHEFGSKRSPKPSYKSSFCTNFDRKTTAAILAKAYFECENCNSKRDDIKTLEMLYHLKEKKLSRKTSVNVMMKEAECLANETSSYTGLIKSLRNLSTILSSMTASPEQKAQANCLKGKTYYYLYQQHFLESQEHLKKAKDDPHLTKPWRIETNIYECLLTLRHPLLKDNEKVVRVLTDVFNDKEASIEQRAEAALSLGSYYYSKETKKTDIKAAEFFKTVIQNRFVTEIKQLRAFIGLVEMHVKKRTDLISNKEALKYCQDVVNSRKSSQLQRNRAFDYEAICTLT